jgi:hypothetical protein
VEKKNSATFRGNAEGDTGNKSTLLGRIDAIRKLNTVRNSGKTLILCNKYEKSKNVAMSENLWCGHFKGIH